MWIAKVGLLKGVQHDTARRAVECPCMIRSRNAVHWPAEEIIRRQQSTVLTDKESDMFKMERRTKQGDPVSSLLFNTVLQAALEDDFKHKREKGTGISLGHHQTDCLSNLRFSDNVIYIFHIAGSAEKHDDRLRKEHRKCRAEDPSGQSPNSQQPKIKQTI